MKNLFRYLRFVIILVIVFGSVEVTPTYADTGAPFRGWLALNGGSAQLSYQTQIALDPVNGSFTLEGWVNNPTFSDIGIYKNHSFELHFNSIKGAQPWIVNYYVSFLICGNPGLCSGRIYPPISSIVLFHFAYVYNQVTNKAAFFWNGEMLDDNVGSVSSSTEPIIIQDVKSVDEFRISNNVRYTASFTPSLTPFVCDVNTKGLWHFDEIAGSTSFHNACGTVDNMFVGSNGAHTEGLIGSKVYLPTIY